ncbi:MAG TPA: hypothetical protein VFA04_27010 [Bryobacteraceae bacterium]|nr:hypothetical protein [Bryobacteraceae bacterium]
MAETVEKTPHPSAGYEHSEASIRMIIGSIVVLALCVVVTCALMVAMFRILHATTGRGPRLSNMANPSTLPPEPRLQEQPWVQLENLRRHENQVLGSYGLDAQTGTIHIPIDRAMDLLLQRGLQNAGGTLPPAAPQGKGSPKNSGY